MANLDFWGASTPEGKLWRSFASRNLGLEKWGRDNAAFPALFAANKIFEAPVPTALIQYLDQDWDRLHVDFRAKFPKLKAALELEKSKHGSNSWESTFGRSKATDELFIAYHYALYVEQVAAAGKKEYPLTLYTNVWQNYVSEDADNDFPIVAGGGGVSNVIDIWHKFAPTLSFIAPDVYLNDYASSCEKYRHNGTALFIPEQRRDEYSARRVWKAFGSYQAIGTSPFGVDMLEPDAAAFTRHYNTRCRQNNRDVANPHSGINKNTKKSTLPLPP